jgi:3-oxoadipate enol-lactonase / 4-carboxymuconolactone decarboxylase
VRSASGVPAVTTMRFLVDGPVGGEPLVLGPSLGTSTQVWEPQLAALIRAHRVLRYDLPGHGRSRAAAPRATVAALAEGVLAMADELGWESFHYAGISLGGAIGTRLALSHPRRVRSLTLLCSSARFGDPSAWHERAALVRAEGTAPLLPASAARWFHDPPRGSDGSPTLGLPGDSDTRERLHTTHCGDSGTPRSTGPHAAPRRPSDLPRRLLADLAAVEPEGYAACCEALAAFDLRARLPEISAPTLVVAGREDLATPPAHARELADAIPRAALVEVPGAAHLANVDRPERVTAAMEAHLREFRPAGGSVRRAVLGDEHVDRATAATTAFTAPFQDLITRYAWGEIWTRPGLDRRTRSCVTLTALVARGHLDELAMHVRAALRNGLTPDEIGEVLLQCAIYCGVPAANAAFAVAQRVLSDVADGAG